MSKKEGVRVIPALCQRDLRRSQPTEQMQSAGTLRGVWVLVQRDLKIQVQLPQMNILLGKHCVRRSAAQCRAAMPQTRGCLVLFDTIKPAGTLKNADVSP